jgi:transposase
VDLRRETDIELLRRVALAQQIQIEQLLRVLKIKCEELEALKSNPEELQQTLALIESLTAQKAAAAAASPTTAKRKAIPKKRERFGPTEQPNLPHVEQVFELDVADRTCPTCGGELTPMKDQFEESEMIDFVEISYRLVNVKQKKCVCRCGGCVETALGPERATRGGRYSLAFAIKVALDKYLDHIPLARQERILRRHGVEITTQTLWDQLSAIARRLAPTEAALSAHAAKQPVIGLDQTSWPKLEADATKLWQMWCITAPGVVCHRIRDDKGAATFKELVGDYVGTIVCDALKTHEAGAREGPGIILAACWAHTYRKFEEAAPDHPVAELALKWIGKLYEIDERAGDDLARKLELRRTESKEVLETLKTWLWSQAVLKTLSIGKAAAYASANWERLTRFVDNALIPSRQQRHRTCDPRSGRGSQKSLRLQIAPRNRSRRDLLHTCRDREAPPRRPLEVLARGRALSRSRRDAVPLADALPVSVAPLLRLPHGFRTGQGEAIRISNPVETAAQKQGFAILALNGVEVVGVASGSVNDDELIRVARLGPSLETMKSADPFLRELACLHGIVERPRHPEFLETAFDEDEELALDVMNDLRASGAS